MRRDVIPVLMLAAATLLGAQAPSPWTLNAALAYARQHSPRLAGARQAVTTGDEAVTAAQDRRLPEIDVAGTLRGSTRATETALGFPLTALADVPEPQLGAYGHLNAAVLASQPLYTGGRIRSAVAAAGARRALAQSEVLDTRRNLNFEVTRAYARLVELDADIQAGQESVRALDESRRIMAQMLQVGRVARVDLLKIDARVALVQDALLNDTNAREVEAGEFNALLGRSISAPVVVAPLPPPAPLIPPAQIPPATSSGNAALGVARAQARVAAADVTVARSALHPELSVAANIFTQGVNPFTAYRSVAAAGFVFTIPVFDRTLNGRVAEASSRELEREDAARQEQFDAMQRARAAYFGFKNALDRSRATRAAVGYAREALRIEQEKYQYGRDTTENLLDAQAALLDTEANYDRAAADETIARAALTRETGR